MRDDRPEALTRPEALDPRQTADWPRQDTGPGPTELSRRLDSLPDGHPSSRYEADGALRHPPVRLADLETPPAEETPTRDPDANPDAPSPDDAGHDDVGATDASRPADTRPFTDAEWEDHKTEVRDRLGEAQADGLATDREYTIDPNGQSWTEERRAAQDAIINDIYARADDIPNQHRAIVAGGLAGAGKTTVLSDHAGIDRSQYLTINPDNIKEELAKRGLIPEIVGLSPMEASDLVHEESSYIARQLALRAQADGKNIIWDITMSSRASADRRIDELRAAGYERIDGIFVDIPVEVSARRADARHRLGQDDFRIGVGLGGRYVPPDVIKSQADPECRAAAKSVIQ